MRHDHLIVVAPAAGGWRVALDDLEPVMFLSGREAEAHARSLATRLAAVGDDARVTVHDRADVLVGSRRYLAE
ncbi:hypothetical protein [Phenylobacterium soli]|uniref:DUF2188 domain-containing protein n=1 Tax=Phenylobacterium soli TaxID=2170551 RepID=A0A328AN95_9CAUL|nr:hypothetical protein [Phenylobacterium soli]RAK56039.1 hypothetical protein DJ017_16745 [Phenylobacterium soli]